MRSGEYWWLFVVKILRSGRRGRILEAIGRRLWSFLDFWRGEEEVREGSVVCLFILIMVFRGAGVLVWLFIVECW